MSSKSLIELAYDFVAKQKGQVAFKEIWAYVVKESGISEEEAAQRVGQFYTNILLDGRFVTLGENEWDLRARQTFDKVHIDMKDVYSDVETSDDDEEEEAERKEYDEVFEEKNESKDDGFENGEETEEENSQEENERGF